MKGVARYCEGLAAWERLGYPVFESKHHQLAFDFALAGQAEFARYSEEASLRIVLQLGELHRQIKAVDAHSPEALT